MHCFLHEENNAHLIVRSTDPALVHSLLPEQNNARLDLHIHWRRTCSSQSHVHKHNNTGPCFQCSCHGSGHFQLNVINKPIRIQASQAAGLDLINAITCSLTKQYTSIPSDPWALDLLMSNNNFMKKTMHISSSDQLILLWSIHYGGGSVVSGQWWWI